MNIDSFIHILAGAMALGGLVLTLLWWILPDSSTWKAACSRLLHKLSFCTPTFRMGFSRGSPFHGRTKP